MDLQLTRTINLIISRPEFWAGVLPKAYFVSLGLGQAAKEWYIPFIDHALSTNSIFVWSSWIEAGGTTLAFPYGVAMLIPFLLIGGISAIFASFGTVPYFITLIAADFCTLVCLSSILKNVKSQTLIYTYWLSPIVILATYTQGYNDLIPVCFLVLGICLIKHSNFRLSSVFLAFAVSAKLSMAVALPFLGIYLFNRKPFRKYLFSFLVIFAGFWCVECTTPSFS